MLVEKKPEGEQDLGKAPETPAKNFSERLFDTLNGSVPQEGDETPTPKGDDAKEAPAPKAEDKPDPRLELYQEKVKMIVDEYEADLKKKKDLLPNTKDEKVKFQIEKDIFELEKKVSSLKEDLVEAPKVVDLSEVDTFFQSNEIKKDGEAWKLVQEMANFKKGGADLVKLFSKVATAVVKDLKVQKQPTDINKDIPKDRPAYVEKPKGEPGLVDQAIENFKKNYS